MSEQEENQHLSVSDVVNETEAVELLFGDDWLSEAVRIEDEANCSFGAGLDWGNALGRLMLNPRLWNRLTQLRISLNREVRLLLSEWNLGVGTTAAIACAKERLLERLRTPAPDIHPSLQAILERDDLYTEEFISDRQELQTLLSILLTSTDWETIATAAANSIREQVIHRVDAEQISA